MAETQNIIRHIRKYVVGFETITILDIYKDIYLFYYVVNSFFHFSIEFAALAPTLSNPPRCKPGVGCPISCLIMALFVQVRF